MAYITRPLKNKKRRRCPKCKGTKEICKRCENYCLFCFCYQERHANIGWKPIPCPRCKGRGSVKRKKKRKEE